MTFSAVKYEMLKKSRLMLLTTQSKKYKGFKNYPRGTNTRCHFNLERTIIFISDKLFTLYMK